ncbi:MAG: hypothetical protein JST87_05270 [Bacteroidetes bacterium]|nr:hypothetical protein [Bacteroidota bacterium]
MIYVKPNPVGIDLQIQAMQQYSYTQLKNIWQITDSDYDSYGRAYRNQTNDGYSPEVYTGSGEYHDVFFDDSLKALSFFGVGENTKYSLDFGKAGSTTAEVFWVFMVNVAKLKPSTTYRMDEEIRMDVENLSVARVLPFSLNGIVTGIENVFKEYSGWKKNEGIKYRDTHPFHCFRLNFNVLYSIDNNSNC